jgi:hypothetical protein
MSLIFPREWADSVKAERVEAVREFGFTERQARFLVTVLVHSGVFIARQYAAFAGIVHGHNTREFVAKLIADGYATPIMPGPLHRGRLIHVQYKPLYEAIGEPNNRNRRPASLGRFAERLMLLDAVIGDRRHAWLGTERDKMQYFFDGRLKDDVPKHWYPRITFGEGPEQTTRYFPEKLPIGVPRDGGDRHVFVYLVTREVPSEFRLFMLRHADLLKWLYEWTVRILIPRRFRKAAALYRYAVRDVVMTHLTPMQLEELDWYFRLRRGHLVCPSPDPDLTLTSAARKFGSARFEALHRMWEREGDAALRAVQHPKLRDQIERGDGRVEFVELSRQYLQLTPLIGVA